MSGAVSQAWLGALVVLGVAMALVDRAMKARWMAVLFAAGGVGFSILLAAASAKHGSQGSGLIPILAGLLAAGYGLVEVLFYIGGRIRQ